MPKLAVIVTRGAFNNLLQVATLVRTAGGAGHTVRVLFRDEAVLKLTRQRINAVDLSPAYGGLEPEVIARLQAADFVDLASYLRECKEHGDDVRLFACTSSMYVAGVREEDLVDAIDAPKSLADFLQEDLADATHVLTF